jgi:hypothetical protein
VTVVLTQVQSAATLYVCSSAVSCLTIVRYNVRRKKSYTMFLLAVLYSSVLSKPYILKLYNKLHETGSFANRKSVY